MGDYQRLQTDVESENIPPIEPKIPPSWPHRLCFFTSFLLMFVVVVYFLWGLPCNLESCSEQHSTSWDKTLYGIELKGHMHLVGGHLVCILRAALWGRTRYDFTPHSGGVIALSALTGDTVWYIRLPSTPIHSDCTILGNKRCLILGGKGLLIAVDYLSGVVAWQMRSQNITLWPQPEDIDFPLGISSRRELITLSRFKPEEHRLVFVSMDSGLITSEPVVYGKCVGVYNLTYSVEGNLHYTCLNSSGTSRVMTYELPDHKTNARTEPIDYTHRLPNDQVATDEHKVVYTNPGSCPTNCQVNITVMDSLNRTVWSYTADKTYLMSPLPLRFRPHITGFLIKLWQWQDQPLTSPSGLKVELIKERIVLITFNKSGSMHVVNASQTDITQLCYANYSECQPQPFQNQSALLVDVNSDGSQDLISYFVTYRPPNENYHKLNEVKDWELQSKVRVVRLEAELPKLYDAISKH